MSKKDEILEILRRRIIHGDYGIRRFPAEGELAEDLDASRVTVRKAINELIEEKLLIRQDNGRVALHRDGEVGGRKLLLAMLQPSYLSPTADLYLDLWRRGMQEAAAQAGATLRVVLYAHWHDAAIRDALLGFDGIFVLPLANSIPGWLVEEFQRHCPRVVILGRDLSEKGIQSVNLLAPASMQKLLDHLAGLGHSQIDCFNIQPISSAITQRVDQWRVWMTAHRLKGALLDESSRAMNLSLRESLPFAYEAMGRLLDAGQVHGTALYCTTSPAALGAMRALEERGISVGNDISVCAVNDEGFNRYLRPSLTSLEETAPSSYLALCIQRIACGGRGWTGPLLMQPDDVTVIDGESTGPCPKAGLGKRISQVAAATAYKGFARSAGSAV